MLGGVIMKKRFVILLGLIALFRTVWRFFKDQGTSDGQEEALFEREGKASEPKEESEAESDQVNINTADAAVLMTIPGIGEDLAGKIIKYRDEFGAFSDRSAIKEVSGIGDYKFEAIQSYITC